MKAVAGGAGAVKFLELLLFLLFFSMFLRAEVFSIPVGGVGVKPFHIIPLFLVFVCLIKYKLKLYRINFIPRSIILFMFLLFLESLVHILAEGLSVSYLKGVFYCFIFLSSTLLHGQYYLECKANGIDFTERYMKFMAVSALAVLFMIAVKNLLFLPDMLSQYLSGLLRPKPAWNFMNFGHSINNEVVFSLMLLPFLRPVLKWNLSIFVIVLTLAMLVLTKVDAAFLFCIFLFLCYLYNYISLRFSVNSASVIFLGVFLLPLIIVGVFVVSSFDELTGGELGRYLLWNGAINTFEDLTLIEKLFGGGNLSYIISGYDDLHSIGQEVMDFHNTYINMVFEFGLLIVVLYIILLLLPVVSALSDVRLVNSVAIFVAFSLLSGWFSPRGLDYLFWYFVPFLLLLKYSAHDSLASLCAINSKE